ncbi:TMEM43 family protein [Luteolibacter sp. AS25]|uniref:TMEM43 family protein n=1 Tax=Luteolibacter sp. AS25 TaxID=3135776 RepID=UPI00398A6C27
MSEHSFTETTSTGWLGRLGGAFKGILVGIVLIIIAVPVLFINEGRAVKTRKTLEEGEKTFVSISADEVNPANDGRLVYLTGPAISEDKLSDQQFGINSEALRLRRVVEMYQWKENTQSETRKKLGGGEETVTTYDYVQGWNKGRIDSSRFKQQAGHLNPEMQVSGSEWIADPINVGAFELSPRLASGIDNFSSVSFDATQEFPDEILGKKATVSGGIIYLGSDTNAPTLGDLRISFEEALPGDVSIISRQRGNSFEPFVGKAGGSIDILETGDKSAEEMFISAHESNKIMTWILRALGVFLMFFGFSAIFRPLSVVADVVPFIGNIVGVGTNLVAILLALPISLVIISFAWIYYRPLIGIPLLVLAVGGFAFLIWKLIAQKKSDVIAV